MAILALVALRPGGYLPAMYVIQALPFLALVLAGGTASVAHAVLRRWRTGRRSRTSPGRALVAARRWPRPPRRTSCRAGTTATAPPLTADANAPYRAAAAWLAHRGDRPGGHPGPGRRRALARPRARTATGRDSASSGSTRSTSTRRSTQDAAARLARRRLRRRPPRRCAATRSTCRTSRPRWSTPRRSPPSAPATDRIEIRRIDDTRTTPSTADRDARPPRRTVARGTRRPGRARRRGPRARRASPSSSRPSTSPRTSASCCAGSPSRVPARLPCEVVFVDDTTDDTPEVIARRRGTARSR